MRTYLNYLGRNKLYTFVSVFGFAASLMFVILLGFYVRHEYTADRFHPNAERLYQYNRSGWGFYSPKPLAPYFQERMPEIEAYCRIFFTWSSEDFFVLSKSGDAHRVDIMYADANIFDLFGYTLAEGNPKTALREKGSVVITRDYARQLYGDENPIGKELNLNGQITYRITGILNPMNANSHIPPKDVIGDFASGADWAGDGWNISNYATYFLLRTGADARLVSEAMTHEIHTKLKLMEDSRIMLHPITRVYLEPEEAAAELRSGSKKNIAIMIAVALLILVLSVMSYVNLTLSNGGGRAREVTLRRLLGSSRWRVALQLWTESLLMTVIGMLLALLGAFLMEPLFDEILNTRLELAQSFSLPVAGVFVFFVLLVSFIISVFPAVLISSFRPIEVVKGTYHRIFNGHISQMLVIAQYVIAMVLLIGAAIMYLQVEHLNHADFGYDTRHKLLVLHLVDSARHEVVRSEIGKISGVRAVGLTCGTPFGSHNNCSDEIDGKTLNFHEFKMDEEALKMLAIPIEPTGASASPAEQIYVNRSGYNTLEPGSDFRCNYIMGPKVVMGVLGQIRIGSFRDEVKDYSIQKIQDRDTAWSILVDYDPQTDLIEMKQRIADVLQKIFGTPYVKMKTSDEYMAEYSAPEHRVSRLMLLFSILAVLLTVMSVFAMSAVRIAQKQKEIAIRKVVGACERQILHIISRRSMWNLLMAFAIAMPISYYVMHRWLQGYAYRITGYWWVFPSALVLVGLVAILSLLGMARSAARSNPIRYLKDE